MSTGYRTVRSFDDFALKAQIERIRASETLARSEAQRRLFEFLAEHSLADKAPKEFEIAIDVFGKDASFDVVQDAMVRVSIHKLRRKLDEYYEGPGRDAEYRIVIPRGEYRLVLETREIAAAPAPSATVETPSEKSDSGLKQEKPSRFWLWMSIGIAAALLVNLSILLIAAPSSAPATALDEVRTGPVWRDVLADNLPVYVVLGDYYLFGELDPASMNVHRLLREYDINSHADLEAFLKSNPQFADRYMDVSLQYLPVSAAQALLRLLPLLQSGTKGSKQVQLILASELTPGMIKSVHIVYVGLLSGMGVLRELAFTGSQFNIGESYDELVHQRTGERYVSQAAATFETQTAYRDYGYFSMHTGPNGNRIVVLAGTRDVAAMHVAETLTQADALGELVKQAGADHDFEAVYAVEAIERMNLGGRLLFAAPLWKERSLH